MSKQSPRKFASLFKFQLVVEALKNENNQTEIARAYQVEPKLISLWKHQLIQSGHKIFEAGRGDQSAQKIFDLEKIIGKQTVEINLLKKFLGHYNSS